MSERDMVMSNYRVRIEIKDFPVEKEAFVDRCMRTLVGAGMVPTWCHEITIYNCGGRQTSDLAEADCKPNYHYAVIRVFDSFWGEWKTDRDRFLSLKHEMAHVLQSPQSLAMENALDCVFPNESDRGVGYKHMKKVLLDAIEFVACDIERGWPVEMEQAYGREEPLPFDSCVAREP